MVPFQRSLHLKSAHASPSLHAAFVNDRHSIKAVGALSGKGQATWKLVRLNLLETGNMRSAKVSMSLFTEFSVPEALHGMLGTQVSPVIKGLASSSKKKGPVRGCRSAVRGGAGPIFKFVHQ